MYRIEEIRDNSLAAAIEIWNEVVTDGTAFPQVPHYLVL